VSWQGASFVALGLVLLGGFGWYERSRPPSQVVALVAALAALAVAGRLALAAIPNVVATTDIAIFSGYALGAAPGFAVGALAGLISNFWLGQGPWTPWQMAGWGLAGILGAGLARACGRRAGRLELTVACGFAGLAYGALLNFSLMASYGGEFTLDRFLTLEARAVPFDVAHAAGNVTLALIAGPAMVRMLMRFRERFEFRWEQAEGRGQREDRGPGVGVAGAGGALGAALLLAVLMLPGSAPRSQAATNDPAVRWLERTQNPDGGFAAAPGEDSSTEMTGWSMLGLEAAGVSPLDVERSGRSAIDYLRRNIADLRTPGDLARTILALRGAGVDAHRFARQDLLARLARRRRRNGSYQGWPNATAFAVMALRASDDAGENAGSLAWLRRAQNSDGGWSAVPGASSDPDSTGAVLQALDGRSRAARRGVRYLRRSQRPSGGWALTVSAPANSQSTAWGIQGLLAAAVPPSSVRSGGRSGLDYLAARRAGDGHYRYSSSSDQTPIWVTAQALAAAELKSFPLAPVRHSDAAVRVPASAAGSGAAGGGSAARVGEGDAGAPRERFAGERGRRSGASAGGNSSEAGVSEGSGINPRPKHDGAARPVSNSLGPQGKGDRDGGGGSPLAPIAIALAAGGLAVGGTWWATKRFRW
jgi:energy-coupling factor transport system substrate-specific component